MKGSVALTEKLEIAAGLAAGGGILLASHSPIVFLVEGFGGAAGCFLLGGMAALLVALSSPSSVVARVVHVALFVVGKFFF